MQQFSITAFAGSVNNQETTLINGEDLHDALGIQTRYSNWILRRIDEYKFVENQDFAKVSKIGQVRNAFGFRGVEKCEYHLTLDMAKELAMVERSEIGRQVRRYFIQIENEHRDAIPAWATVQLSETQAQLQAAQALALSVSPKLPAVREFVRLLNLGLSHREVAILLQCGDTTVGRMAQRLRAAGVLNSQPPNTRLVQLSLPHVSV